MNYLDYVDEPLLKKFEHFMQKVNERTEKAYGLRADYSDDGDPAFGEDVEYFHFYITADDRMRYIMENIVSLPNLSPQNKIANTIISHFYGARGIHSLLSGFTDPKLANVDFHRIANDDHKYVEDMRATVLEHQRQKHRFYGTTELHTSLQTAARNFCRIKYKNPARPASAMDIAEWIGSWIADGSIDHIVNNVKSLHEMFNFLRTKAGVGEYYGYHCATSNSVNPMLPFQHDERFCAPGPGARETLDVMFAPLKPMVKKFPYAELVILLREKQGELFDPKKIASHPFFHNFSVNGKDIFETPQNELKTYTTEVACCQFGVYRYLSVNQHLINKRRVARVELATPSAASCLLEF